MAKNFPQDLNDWDEYRGMVHWFSPMVLLKTAKKVVESSMFGKYADRRLVQAALDSPLNKEKLIEDCCGGEKGVGGKEVGLPIWVDYVADLGDGWDSTYAIAYLIGQENLPVDEETLPRADCLIMGGDQVYPDAEREEYKRRMLRPYRAAFPRTSENGAAHPRVFLIPGNHDWYDGLSLFLANFCNGRDTPIGSWISTQRRSYFAVHLGENWWIWGFDSQLGEDIDKPQADYFAEVARKMPDGAKVILCASVPTWLKADLAGDPKQQDRYYRALHYMASMIGNECRGARIPVVISGDLHHYSRYVGHESGTNFITAGGGGAFLHPTHHLKDKINTKWPREGGNEEALEIGQEGNKKAFFPPQKASRRLAPGNIAFCKKNWDFCLVLALLYLVCGLLMLAWSGYGDTGVVGAFAHRFWTQVNTLWPTPIFLLTLLGLSIGMIYSGDVATKGRKIVLGSLHALSHLALILFGTAFITTMLTYFGVHQIGTFGELAYFLGLIFGMLALGFIGGFVWGLYLIIASSFWGDESNNAFGAMRLDSYRHFMRFKIERDRLTIYPIGIDKSPKRSVWKSNPAYVDASPDQNTPAFIPSEELGQHLIEPPIVIDVKDVSLLKAVG